MSHFRYFLCGIKVALIDPEEFYLGQELEEVYEVEL